ncbi:NADH-quinone oxidoreductase, subunit E [Candidatus Terasakiella magnetica]|uniref:NADH-quinone oxidoreductase, subunit E n=1 Tax=Candidatus Terasakiella magnetica TaxID=1867952 RepID=A0A1C3RCP7_9PROT|nr:NADH-quinone oxidoreductase subunit NuoE [Candidatus Terasakiella magnetica]SCA54992.1 NADH-quinone oxidoreductase, subunit E [Candidatus Terasakiella magnetica]
MSNMNFQQPDSFEFSPENLELAKKHIAKYPEGKQQSACMPLLDLAQRQYGWLPTIAMDVVADMLGMAPVRVYEVATFYTMFNKEPVGKHHVQVCTNISCWLRGSDDIVTAVQQAAEINTGETSADGLITLWEVECLGACSNAPMMQINDDYFEDLTGEDATRIINDLRSGKEPATGPQNGRTGAAPLGELTSLTGDA